MRKYLHKILICINLLLIASLLLSYLSVYISPEDLWVLAFFGLVYPYILLLNLFFLIYWLIRKKKKLFILSLLVIALGWSYITDLIQLPFSSNKQANTESSLKFLSYNIRLFDLYNWSHNKATRDRIFDFINKEKPDILCFQEFYSDDIGYFSTLDTLTKFQKASYSHTAYTSNVQKVYHFGIATFSTYPIVSKGSIRFEKTGNICIYTDIKINNDTIRIYNNHLESIRFQAENYNFIDSIYLKNNEQIKGVKDIMRKLKYAYIKRAHQADIISENIQQSPYPVIVCGDFNDTPVSYAYHKIKNNLKDAFVESGSGIGNTYLGKLPFLRIDFILHSKTLKSCKFEIPKVKFSDHYPILCWFKIGKE